LHPIQNKRNGLDITGWCLQAKKEAKDWYLYHQRYSTEQHCVHKDRFTPWCYPCSTMCWNDRRTPWLGSHGKESGNMHNPKKRCLLYTLQLAAFTITFTFQTTLSEQAKHVVSTHFVLITCYQSLTWQVIALDNINLKFEHSCGWKTILLTVVSNKM
jgi:hypothetical protein